MESKTVLDKKISKNINEMSKVRKMEQRLRFFQCKVVPKFIEQHVLLLHSQKKKENGFSKRNNRFKYKKHSLCRE
ncbi:hypothetical protein AX758_09650 [Enterococcus mundtii]|nr:hypothetical protein AX758_09650 [Enterococcus mundtii]